MANELENRLWEVADSLRANAGLKASEYSTPVLGLIFLRYADFRFSHAEADLKQKQQESGSRRSIGKADYQARGVMYLPDIARFEYLLKLPEGANVGKALNDAMKAIETENEELKGVLPTNYTRFENHILIGLLKAFHQFEMDIEGDVFGKVYEYFLGKFARAEGQLGGEFFTPTSLVKLIVEIIEPYHGRILDPACGSGGMFVQSARFVKRHQGNPNSEISIYGQEKTIETVRLCQMNLAVHGISGTKQVKQANTYYENVHDCLNHFDFVMANPPFNVNGVDKDRIKDDPRYPFGIPRPDNANYLWIQEFYSALNDKGRAGFVMANSASDARDSEMEIRKKLIEDGVVDVMVAIGGNFFQNVTLPCTLWFFDKGKRTTDRKEKVLFIDARHIYRQVDRAHRDFTEEQLEFLSNIVRLYRGIPPETDRGSEKMLQDHFPGLRYQDVPGLCKVATQAEIEAQGWSLNPGRYVGVKESMDMKEADFQERLEALHEELEQLNAEAHTLEDRINENINQLLGV
jgi:type I restriction enzyme M protein